MAVNPYIIVIPVHTGERGTLAVVEDLGFPIQRIFYILDVPEGAERGHHGHQNTTQCLTCIHGEVEIIITNENGTFNFTLNAPSQALIMPPNNHIVLKNFRKGSIVLVVASTLFKDDILQVKHLPV